jgi:hypothetical protein
MNKKVPLRKENQILFGDLHQLQKGKFSACPEGGQICYGPEIAL